MKKYIVSIDEGTTSTRAMIVDKNGEIVSVSGKEFSVFYPQPGCVEQDPEEIYTCVLTTLAESIIKGSISVKDIAGIGITNQRETTVVWDRKTGKPLYNAIVWQCRRTAPIVEELIKAGISDYIKETTGLLPDAYFSATKIKWILDNVEGSREKAEKGELLFGTIDTWIIWKLTAGKIHVTDCTNASRTMLFDINKKAWDKKLLDILGIPESMLPEVRSSSEIYGYASLNGEEIPICGIAGDQQAALFGQKCFLPGEAKNTYGTGCFLLMNTGTKRVLSKNGLVTTIAATLRGEETEYALEGSVFVGGAVIKWLRDEMKLIDSAAESETAAARVEDTRGVYVVPAFAGLGAPHWNMYARGTVFGLTSGCGKDHFIRAALESIAYQTNDLLDAMKSDVGFGITSLKVDGGASNNSLLMQFQSDVSRLEVTKPDNAEVTSLGAAFLAGLAVGFWKDRDEIRSLGKKSAVFSPVMEEDRAVGLVSGWRRAVRATKLWTETE